MKQELKQILLEWKQYCYDPTLRPDLQVARQRQLNDFTSFINWILNN